MTMRLQRVICVVGPTAVGKSSVAEDVALELNGAVVSVDSMQVYRGMDIGTAKTPVSERRCPLYMVDVVEADSPYSVVRFQRDARTCIDALIEDNKVAVLCGGTGLYLDAVIDQMSFPHGKTGSSARERYERIAQNEGAEALHRILVERDEQSAREIHPNNVRRVVRALEMLDEGVSYAEHHRGLKKRNPYYDAQIWALVMSRERLYARIDARVDKMFEQGLVDEVKGLAQRGLCQESTAGAAIGYKELLSALQGDGNIDAAKELIKRNTRRYAKRQLSWIKRDGRARTLDMSRMGVEEAVYHICKEWRASSL